MGKHEVLGKDPLDGLAWIRDSREAPVTEGKPPKRRKVRWKIEKRLLRRLARLAEAADREQGEIVEEALRLILDRYDG